MVDEENAAVQQPDLKGDAAVRDLESVLPPPPPPAVKEVKKDVEPDPFAGKTDVQVVLEMGADLKATTVNGLASLLKVDRRDPRVKDLEALSWKMEAALAKNADWIAPRLRGVMKSGKWVLVGAVVLEVGGIWMGLRAIQKEQKANAKPEK